MALIWDYDIKDLNKSETGRILLLERQINYGIYPSDKEKIRLADVRKYWKKLRLSSQKRRLFEFLLWEK